MSKKLIIKSEQDYRDIKNILLRPLKFGKVINAEENIREILPDLTFDKRVQELGYEVQKIEKDFDGREYNIYYNIEIDLSNAPLLQEIDTGYIFRQVFSAPKSGVSYYIKDGEKLFLDSSGTTRPNRTEKHHMGMGIYMSDSMFQELKQLTLF